MKHAFRTLTAFLLAYAFAFGGLPAQAQSTRILDGSYVTKFGRYRNFVINPDAQVNNTDGIVSGGNKTLLRSTTTPISENGTTEFTLVFGSSTNFADWSTTGATQAILGGQMCEVGFRGRGFQSTTSLQAYDGTNVLATYNFGLLSNTTDVSLPFPCPLDPSTMRVRITDSATLSGTNEIAGVYFGKARNIGDAANISAWVNCTSGGLMTGQGSKVISRNQCRYRRNGDTMDWDWSATGDGTASGGGSTAIAVSMPDGLLIDSNKTTLNDQAVKGQTLFYQVLTALQYDAAGTVYPATTSGVQFTKPASADVYRTSDLNHTRLPAIAFSVRGLPISNWPTASSAVTPANQNVYGARKWDGNQTSTTRNTNAYLGFSGATYASNVTNIGSATACASTSDLCLKIPNLPAGDYSVSVTGSFEAGPQTSCAYAIGASNDSSNLITTVESTSSLASENSYVSSFSGVYTNSTTADREFYILGNRISGSNSCAAIGASSSRRLTIELKPLSRAQIQPVFVQSPVRAAATGVSPNTGEVGKSTLFSSQSISAVTTNFVASGVLATLTPGCYMLNGVFGFSGATNSRSIRVSFASNNANDSTGLIGFTTTHPYAQTAGAINASLPMIPYFYCTTTTVSLYAKAFAENAAQTVSIDGFYTNTGDR